MVKVSDMDLQVTGQFSATYDTEQEQLFYQYVTSMSFCLTRCSLQEYNMD